MRNFTLTLLAVTASLIVADTSNADDDISKDDGVVYMASTEPGVEERFYVFKDGNDLEIVHSVYLNGYWEEINDKDYNYNHVDLIMFVGDNDRDKLIFDISIEDGVYIPVVGWGFGGDDLLSGGIGSCVLYGGEGSDYLYGTLGNDYLDPGSDYQAHDVLVGYGGANTFVRWQEYKWNSRTGKWELKDIGSFATPDFDASEGDVVKTRIKSKYSTQPVTSPQMSLDPTKNIIGGRYQAP